MPHIAPGNDTTPGTRPAAASIGRRTLGGNVRDIDPYYQLGLKAASVLKATTTIPAVGLATWGWPLPKKLDYS
jgi:hypothetical protein